MQAAYPPLAPLFEQLIQRFDSLFLENAPECRICSVAASERFAVLASQRLDFGIAALLANFSVAIALSSVESLGIVFRHCTPPLHLPPRKCLP